MRIMLVEDDDLTRELLASILGGRGHVVYQARGAIEALARLKGSLEVDCLVTDLFLPDKSGQVVLQESNRVPRKIALTALESASVSEGVILLRKPVLPDKLVAVIEGASP